MPCLASVDCVSGVVLNCFTLSRPTVFNGIITHKTRKWPKPLFKVILYSVSVMGQETCEVYINSSKVTF